MLREKTNFFMSFFYSRNFSEKEVIVSLTSISGRENGVGNKSNDKKELLKEEKGDAEWLETFWLLGWYEIKSKGEEPCFLCDVKLVF